MKGMLPPVPMYMASRPKKFLEAVCTADSSQGSLDGAFHPPMLDSSSNLTCAPYGGSRSSVFLTATAARSGSTPGGRRNERTNAVIGRNTLPALLAAGMPSTPVTDNVGRQVLLSRSSAGSSDIGFMPSTNGILR